MKRFTILCLSTFSLLAPLLLYAASGDEIIDVGDEVFEQAKSRMEIIAELTQKHRYRGKSLSPQWFERAYEKHSPSFFHANGEFVDVRLWPEEPLYMSSTPPKPQTRYREIPSDYIVFSVINENEVLITRRYDRHREIGLTFHLKGIDTGDLADGAPVEGKTFYVGNFQYVTIKRVETEDPKTGEVKQGDEIVVDNEKYTAVAGSKKTVQSFVYCQTPTLEQFATMLDSGKIPDTRIVPPPKYVTAIDNTYLFDEQEHTIGRLTKGTEVELLRANGPWYEIYCSPQGQGPTNTKTPAEDFTPAPVYLEALKNTSARTLNGNTPFTIPAEHVVQLLRETGEAITTRYWLPENGHIDLVAGKDAFVEAGLAEAARNSLEVEVKTNHAFGTSTSRIPCQCNLSITMASLVPLSDLEVHYSFWPSTNRRRSSTPPPPPDRIISGVLRLASVGTSPATVQTKTYNYIYKPSRRTRTNVSSTSSSSNRYSPYSRSSHSSTSSSRSSSSSSRTSSSITSKRPRSTDPPEPFLAYRINIYWRGCRIKSLERGPSLAR